MNFLLVVVRISSAFQILSAEPNLPTSAELRAYLCAARDPLSSIMRDRVFRHENQLRPKLRALLRDNRFVAGAREELALIADPRDVALLVRSAPEPGGGPWSGRWAYGVAAALLEPTTEAEWAFLRSSAMNEFHDRWVEAAAIQTLKLIASPRSLALLEEVRERNTERPKSCDRAIEYVLSNPPPLRDIDLDRLAKRIAEVNRIGQWQGNQNTRYNVEGDRALIDVVYDTGEDVLIYTATFHRVDGLWRLRAFRETLQKFVIRAIVPATLSPDLPAPPDIRLGPVPLYPEDLMRSLEPLKAPSDLAAPQQKK